MKRSRCSNAVNKATHSSGNSLTGFCASTLTALTYGVPILAFVFYIGENGATTESKTLDRDVSHE